MNDGSDHWQELDSVLDRVLDGIYDDNDLRQLNGILRDNVEACQRYVLYVELHGRLAWGDGLRAKCGADIGVSAPVETIDAADLVGSAVQLPSQRSEGLDTPVSPTFAPIIIQTSPGIPSSFSPSGSFLFSYAVAAVTVAIGLLIGWACRVSVSQQQTICENGRRPAATTIAQTPGMVFVGQITGMFDCQWANSSAVPMNNAYVPLGHRYALASGLMEISYDTGAKVILQGPCVYEVASRTGGYLALGRVTARVETKAEGGRRKTGARAGDNPSPLSPLLSSLFSVRTPTAIITDLGTEFGVEVDQSGASQAHVFRGKVEIRAVDGNTKEVSLGANESARVNSAKGRVARVVRQGNAKTAFVREMPNSARIVVFNTGVGLKAGDPDPHWQIVARTDDPKFTLRPAVVRGMKPDDFFLEDDPNRSQWLSLLAGDRDFPEDVVFVFRTEFDLTGMLPSTAVLRGKFLADDRVVAIRLNGRRLPVPVHRDGGPFLDLTSFRIASGFVKGKNVLEFDVLNANPYLSPSQGRTLRSRMSFRAELEGSATRDPGWAGDQASGKTSRAPPQAGKTAADRDQELEQEGVARGMKEMPLAGAL
jgi:hypothetical protein